LKPVLLQLQVKVATPSMQTPPLKHGLGSVQSLTLCSQSSPANPVAQAQV
jgi:hypothetical protein